MHNSDPYLIAMPKTDTHRTDTYRTDVDATDQRARARDFRRIASVLRGAEGQALSAPCLSAFCPPAFCLLAFCLLAGGLLPASASAQERSSQPRIGIPIVLTDDAGGRQVLEVGIDPSATDGVDSGFGEERAPLAPPNPTNVFATLVDDNVGGVDQLPGTGTKIDVRQGQEGFAGEKSHEISLEFGPDDINQITFRWDLPAGVTGTLEVVDGRDETNFDMTGSGSAAVQDLSDVLGNRIQRAEVTLDYDGSQKRTLRNVVPGTDGTGNDTGWRLLAPPTEAVRGDLQDDLSFDVDSGTLMHTWDGGGPGAWSPATSASDPLRRGEGFILYFFDDDVDPVLGSGLPLDAANEGEGQSQDVTIGGLNTSNRFHLLGNPYDAPFGLGGLAGGDLPGQGFQQAVQVWDPGQQQFEPLVQGSGQIDSWQGFFVERTTPGQGASSIAFSASGRQPGSGGSASGEAGAVVASGSESAGRKAGGSPAAVRLEVSAGEDRASATVFLGEEATAGWDGYDATRIAPPGGAAVAAGLPTKRGGTVVQRVMGSLPYPGEEEARSVPLSVKGAPGERATVRWPEAAREQVPDGWTVELEDTRTGTRVDLRQKDYTFDLAEGGSGLTGPNEARFRLHIGPATAVPVEMAGLEASVVEEAEGPEGKAVRLTWQTASEQNNAGFYVQRQSASDGSWRRLGFVESKAAGGTTAEPKSYRFTDRGLPYAADTLTYRLRQVDTDGTAHRTDAVSLALGAPGQLDLEAPVPNPASERATLRFAVPEGLQAEEVRIGVYDLLGRQVATVADGRREAGRHEQQMDLSGLPSGTYFLRLRVGEEIESQKLTVLR